MIKTFGKWIAIALIVLLAFVGVVPQQAQASTEQESDIPLVLFCPLLNGGDIDRYDSYYLPESNEYPSDGAVKVTFYGTTMLLFDDGDTKILIDAHITRPYCSVIASSLKEEEDRNEEKAANIFTVRRLVAHWLKRSEVKDPFPSALFIAHSHHDHAMDAPYIAQQTGATLYGSESTLKIAKGNCLPGQESPCLTENKLKLYEDLDGSVEIGDFTVTVLPGTHSPNPDVLPDDIGKPINAPVIQPAKFTDYKEGGSYSFLIEHGDNSILVNLAVPKDGTLDGVQADVLFLATPAIKVQEGTEDADMEFYNKTVGQIKPKLVIPVHWDNFTKPLYKNQYIFFWKDQPLVPFNDDALDNTFDFLTKRLGENNIKFGIMRGNQSVMLFEQAISPHSQSSR